MTDRGSCESPCDILCHVDELISHYEKELNQMRITGYEDDPRYFIKDILNRLAELRDKINLELGQ